MNVETRTLVRSALDATEYTRGAQQVAQANERMATTGEAVAGATERSTVRLRESGGAIERLQRSLDPAYGAMQKLERAQVAINAAMERGAISAQRATQLIGLAQQRYATAGTAAQAFATANDNATTRSGRFTQAMGQAGFQLQDFAVQVQGGTSALTALSQQGSQFLGMFGTGGAIAGAVLTVGILASKFLDLGGATDRAEAAEKAYAEAVNTTNGFLLTAIQRTQALATARRMEEAGTVEQQLEAQRARYRDVIAERDRLRGVNDPADAGAFVTGNVVAADRARLALLDAQEALLRGRIAELEERMRQTAEGASGEERDRAEHLRRTLDDRYRILREHEEKVAELRQLASRGLFPGGDLAQAEAQAARQRDEALRALTAQADRAAERSARTAEREADRIAREEQRARDQREREEERAREAQAREEQRALEQREAENRRTTDSIVNYGAEAFADMFEANGRGWSGMLDSFLSTFRRLMARIAAEAIIRPIVAPIVSALGFGGSSSATGATGGFASNLFGLSGIGSQLSGALGLGSGAFGGIGGSLTNLINTPLWGGNVAGPAFNGIAASGAPTVGGILGGAGLGFGAGMLANGLLGGNATGGMIGSGGGALAGALIGSLIPGVGTLLGGLLGGAGGGALGGLFGPSNTTPFWGARVEGVDGALAITDSGGKRDNGQLRALLEQTQAQMAQVNAALAASGISVAGARMVGSDPADPTRPGSLNDAAKFFSFSAKDSTLNRVLGSRTFETFDQVGAAANWVLNTYNAMAASASAAETFARQIQAVNDNFEAAARQAREYGLETDRIAIAQRRATETLQAQREAGILSSALGQSRILGDFLAGMARGTGSAQSQFGAAQEQFAAALEAARRGGRGADLNRVTGAAQALLEANAAFNASGATAATVEGMVRSTLANLGVSLDLPGFADNLDASINRWGEAQVDELKLLVDGVAAMREELRTQNLAIRQILAA